MPVRTHRRKNFKKRNHTKRNTRHNTKRRLNRRIKRTKRYTRKRGGDNNTSDTQAAENAPANLNEGSSALRSIGKKVWRVVKFASDEANKVKGVDISRLF